MKKLLIFISLAVALSSCAGTPKKNETNEALNKANTEGLYAGWYQEALDMAASETAEEVSVDD